MSVRMSLIERADAALAMNAENASDYEWSVLLAVAMDMRAVLSTKDVDTASMIAKHEPSPVDPVEAAVEEIYTRWVNGSGGAKVEFRAAVYTGIAIAEGRAT